MGLPVYKQLIESIKKDVESAEPNSPILSERELAERYQVSRMTARKAVDELVRIGVLYRDKNRGTFIAEQKLHKELDSNWIFNSIAMSSSHKVLYFDVKYANEQVARMLHMRLDDLYIRLVKINKIDNHPVSVDEVYVERHMATTYKMETVDQLLDFHASPHDLVIKQTFQPVIVPEKYAALLKVKMGSPIQLVQSQMLTHMGDLVSVIFSYVNVQNVQVEVTL
ncbi:MAG: GntR family transcriptional regulator [Erysipelotrichaceae bacterium]